MPARMKMLIDCIVNNQPEFVLFRPLRWQMSVLSLAVARSR